MIVVCEPQCKSISHLKVNSGFIYGLHLAYPKEKIVFFADTSHFNEVKNLLGDNGINTKKLKHIPIQFNSNKSFSLEGILRYYLLFKKIFNKALLLQVNKIFYLSTGPIILHTIKKLKQQKKYKNICCTFVLHGDLEDIANISYKKPYIPRISVNPKPLRLKGVVVKVFKNINKLPSFLLSKLLHPFSQLYLKYSLFFKKIFRMKKMMMWNHSCQYKYISLSPHVTKNAKKYLDTKYLNFHTIILPIVFNKPTSSSKNKYIKFAVFGYGDSSQIHKMLLILSKKKISKPYEIRIISMDSRGTEGFQNIHRLSQGRVLTRKEMENSAKDVDIFINLYDKSRHRLGCSLSIFEAFSYLKPILHLSNPGYDHFNKSSKPIGYKTETLNEFVDKMYDMIENYDLYRKKLSVFRKNMLDYRKEYNIKNNLINLKNSFSFN
jgi:hypothetical protein